MDWFTAAQFPLLIIIIWLFTVWATQSFPTLTNKRILLLIAHPDDEAMFFAPTLLSLSRPELGNQIIILCLSSGDADGLGHIRKGELERSALQLGIRSSEHVVVLEDAQLPDSMTAEWDPKYIAGLLAKYFAPQASKTRRDEAPTATMDVLLTFDAAGVSGHPNHKALYHGAVAFVQGLMQRHAGWEAPVKIYALTTTNVLRKYMSVVDAFATVTTLLWRQKEKGATPTPLVTMSGPWNWRKAQRAMTTAHKSQMRWFRWGWIGISRYMVLNDLIKVKTTGS